MLHEKLEPPFGLPQLARALLDHALEDLRALDLALDVRAGAEPVGDVAAGFFEQRDRASVMPAIDAVGAPEAKLDLIALARLERAGPARQTALPFIGMHDLLP